MRILFQGDSITDGNRGRTDDPNHIMGHGYAFSIASKLGAEHPEIEFINRGVSGNTVIDLLARWTIDAIQLNPDIVSILIGTNDTRPWNIFPDRFESIYRMLLQDLPHAKFILCEPFKFQGDFTDDEWNRRKTLLKEYQKRIRKIAEDTGSIFVPLQDLFENACNRAPLSHWIWDGTHPTVAGHYLLMQRWLECSKSVLGIN